MKTRENLNTITKKIRKSIITMAYESGQGHIGSALCLVEILTILLFKIMRLRDDDPNWKDRDRIILSKGHGASGLYAALAARGLIAQKLLNGYCKDGGTFHLHPCRHTHLSIETSTGSLGHGLSVGAGLALALKMRENVARVFVVIGDGECNEGSIWEAAAFIIQHKLTNTIIVVDHNKFQGFGKTKEILDLDLVTIWQAFGFEVLRCDGHDLLALQNIFDKKMSNKPRVVIAETIAGKGAPFFEDSLDAHYSKLTKDQYDELSRSFS